jgi:amidohydrolase
VSTATTGEQPMDRGVLATARAVAPEVVADRRAIHQHPELAFGEHRTAALVATRLAELGLDVRTGVAETGVVGLLRGGDRGSRAGVAGGTVLLRADMDALPIQESNDAPYASRVPGVMHACGHDAHTAILLGVARVLAGRRDEVRGNVKFLFQPAEETCAGAQAAVAAGVLDDPPVTAAFGLHVAPEYPAGRVAIREGTLLAGGDDFVVTVRGKGGSGVRPHTTVDPVVVAAYVVTALQTLVSREVAPGAFAVVSVGSLVAGDRPHVVPQTATLRGTIRTYDPATRDRLVQRLPELAAGVAAGMRARAETAFPLQVPPVVNDPALARLARDAVAHALGPAAVVADPPPGLASDDVAWLLERVPGVFLLLGVRHPAWERPRPPHTPSFDVDEDALPVGVAALAAVALRYLSGGDA